MTACGPVLDCAGVNDLRLRRPDRDLADLVLTPGVHAVGRDGRGDMALVGIGHPMLAQFCIDRRGIWMQLAEGVRGVHVNGRPVRRMAMLRPGDAVFVEGIELVLVGPAPEAAPAQDAADQDDQFDLGWIGLAGLVGLLGLMRRDRHNHREHHTTTTTGRGTPT